ncbi:MAG: class B sortase [Oscillospiraceae bacterium]|nr:class B sortase [Oscillospiraceae bacterium]
MWRIIRGILIFVLGSVFLTCTATVLIVRHQYKVNEEFMQEVAKAYTSPVEPAAASQYTAVKTEDGEERELELAPILVEFDLLRAVNSDVVGWIFCDDTVINYPILYGGRYINTSLTGESNVSGCIFEDPVNNPGFGDSNMILYGHHMADGTMFAGIKYWQNMQYLKEHPYFWILTPTQDYKVEVFSAYVTEDTSSSYTIYYEPSGPFTDYIKWVRSLSWVDPEFELDPDAHYVMLSTCAYAFDNARSVVHGKMIPVDSAAGRPIERTVAPEAAASAEPAA